MSEVFNIFIQALGYLTFASMIVVFIGCVLVYFCAPDKLKNGRN